MKKCNRNFYFTHYVVWGMPQDIMTVYRSHIEEEYNGIKTWNRNILPQFQIHEISARAQI